MATPQAAFVAYQKAFNAQDWATVVASKPTAEQAELKAALEDPEQREEVVQLLGLGEDVGDMELDKEEVSGSSATLSYKNKGRAGGTVVQLVKEGDAWKIKDEVVSE